MSSDDATTRPDRSTPPTDSAEPAPRSGEGAGTALLAMIKKRQMGLTPVTDASQNGKKPLPPAKK